MIYHNYCKKLFSTQDKATIIANQANGQFKPQLINLRIASGNTNPTDAQLQQVLQLAGASTTTTGAALNTNVLAYNWANYVTASRVQAAPTQAQAFQDSLSTVAGGNLNTVISAMQNWNTAAPFSGSRYV